MLHELFKGVDKSLLEECGLLPYAKTQAKHLLDILTDDSDSGTSWMNSGSETFMSSATVSSPKSKAPSWALNIPTVEVFTEDSRPVKEANIRSPLLKSFYAHRISGTSEEDQPAPASPVKRRLIPKFIRKSAEDDLELKSIGQPASGSSSESTEGTETLDPVEPEKPVEKSVSEPPPSSQPPEPTPIQPKVVVPPLLGTELLAPSSDFRDALVNRIVRILLNYDRYRFFLKILLAYSEGLLLFKLECYS